MRVEGQDGVSASTTSDLSYKLCTIIRAKIVWKVDTFLEGFLQPISTSQDTTRVFRLLIVACAARKYRIW